MQKFLRFFIAILIIILTCTVVWAIAAVKNNNAVGGGAYRLQFHMAEYNPAKKMIGDIGRMGRPTESEKIMRLILDGKLWIAPNLKDRQGMYVSTLSLVHRVYLDKGALENPAGFLDRLRFLDMPAEYKNAFGYIMLAGTVFHEFMHYSGHIDEAYAYDQEIRFYEGIQQSTFYNQLSNRDKEYYNWALESALKSVQKARELELGVKE